jgi:hypothetical protein
VTNSQDRRTSGAKIRPTAACSSEEELLNLAAGLCPEAVGGKLLQHAATCDYCGPLLQAYTEDLQEDFSDEERAELEKLNSASPQWQLKMARKMVKPIVPPKPTPWRNWKWAYAFALPLLLVGGTIWSYSILVLRPFKLSVEAEYRKRRPTYRSILGAKDLVVIEPPEFGTAPLLAANAALLKNDFNTAETRLLTAERNGDKSLPILNNLVVAYAMEADAPPHDYQKALDAADQVLRINSSDPIALFNRALILVNRNAKDDRKEAITILETLANRADLEYDWRKEAAHKLQLLR